MLGKVSPGKLLTDIHRTDTKINVLMAYVINTGLLTGLCAVCSFVSVSLLTLDHWNLPSQSERADRDCLRSALNDARQPHFLCVLLNPSQLLVLYSITISDHA